MLRRTYFIVLFIILDYDKYREYNMKKIFLLIILLFSISGCTKLSETSYSYPTDEVLVSHFLDVGQADSSFIELPNKETILIDAGEAKSSDIISNYIKDLGYQKIDYVIATHPHADHIGGMRDIIETFEVGDIYMPKVASTSKTYENLLLKIQEKGFKIHTGKSGVEIINNDNLRVEMLAPNKEKYSSYNNYSIVLKITYKEKVFIYMGDAEELSESEITSNIKSDVLKVGHHGSDTSSSTNFLKRVRPSYAIISVGENNKYNHPASSTIKRLEKYTNNIYRTDLNGNIIVTSDGVDITVNTEK